MWYQLFYTGSADKAGLVDLLRELQGVISWFKLGVELKIPIDRLLAIRADYMNKVDDCKTQMLIVWLRLGTCTWTSLIIAVVNIGRRDIAETLGKKYGEGCFSSICTFLYTCTYLSITLHIQASQYR